MVVGDRLRELREAKKLSQGDIEERTGLLRCYVSRVENGHTIPSLGTLEKFAKALDVGFCQLFPPGDDEPVVSPGPAQEPAGAVERKLVRTFRQMPAKSQQTVVTLTRLFERIAPPDQKVLSALARYMVRTKKVA